MGKTQNKALFLDRDGVILKERGEYNYKQEHMQINDGIIEFLEAAKVKGYLLIIITNQGGIAKKIYGHKEVSNIHHTLKEFFASYQMKIDEIYYCPHHDSVEKCLCRKPGTLLFEKAIARFHINKEESLYIGDQERDLLAGQAAGIETIRIRANENLEAYIGSLQE